MKKIIPLCILSACFIVGGCDSGDSVPYRQEEKLPFTVIERDERLTYALRLPDGGSLLLLASTAGGTPSITSASISSAEGIVYAADYPSGEFLILDPESKSEVIFLKSDDGFIRAPESIQDKHRQTSQMFEDFATKHVGSFGDVDGATEDLKILKGRLPEVHDKK